MDDLLPCPFCGGDAKPMPLEFAHVVRCDGCGAEGPWVHGMSHEESVIAWNEREPRYTITARGRALLCDKE